MALTRTVRTLLPRKFTWTYADGTRLTISTTPQPVTPAQEAELPLGSIAAEQWQLVYADIDLNPPPPNPPTGGTDVSPDAWKVMNGGTVQTALDSVDAALVNARSTGVLYGGALTDLGAGQILIAAGVGGILDNGIPQDPTYTRVTWGEQTIDLSATEGRTWVYVDTDGAVQTTTIEPTADDYRTRIILHRVIVRSGVVSNAVAVVAPLQQYGAGVHDILRYVGPLSSGFPLSPAGTDLSLAAGAGTIVTAGVNFYENARDPHSRNYPAVTPVTFQYRNLNNEGRVNTTQLEPGLIDADGSVVTLPGANARAAIHALYLFGGQQANYRMLRPQTDYPTLDDAVAAAPIYRPVVPGNFEQATLLGYVIARKDATDLTDPLQARIIHADRFGRV